MTTKELAIEAAWDIALTDNEVKALAAGMPPTLIQPKHLVYYRPAGPQIKEAL